MLSDMVLIGNEVRVTLVAILTDVAPILMSGEHYLAQNVSLFDWNYVVNLTYGGAPTYKHTPHC